MKLIAGEILADSGEINKSSSLKVARLVQDVPTGTVGTIFQVVASGLGDLKPLLESYHEVLKSISEEPSITNMQALESCQQAPRKPRMAGESNRWSNRLSKFGLDPDAQFNALSGGMKRRVLLARALVVGPDVFLTSQPTIWIFQRLNGWRTKSNCFRAPSSSSPTTGGFSMRSQRGL